MVTNVGKYDKDRFQKEMAVQYCLANRMTPFLEVKISTTSRLSAADETLTDLDVVGISADASGTIRRVFFDCKSGQRTSAVNRAFWAAGVRTYLGYDQAYVILKDRPPTGHRISALTMEVDLHDDASFRALGRRMDESFPHERYYQSSIERWHAVNSVYEKYAWTEATVDLVRNQVPVTNAPCTTFRHVIAELLKTRGQYDPERSDHVAIFLDILSSTMVVWGSLARDISRFFDGAAGKASFEDVLRYYFWGGKDGYEQRRQIAKYARKESTEIPEWGRLVELAARTAAAPTTVVSGSLAFRELSVRSATDREEEFDKELRKMFVEDSRLRRFMLDMSDYLVGAGGLPEDLGTAVKEMLLSDMS